MANRLLGKTAFITGAAQGIGLESVRLFAQEGATVIASDRNARALEAIQEMPSVETRVLDVTDAAGIRKVAREIGSVDVLFNCAGIVHEGTILECGEEQWDEAFAINTRSMFYTIRAFLPAMLELRKGSIVNMASVASSVAGIPSRFAYTASKAAVIGMTKAIATDFAASGIRCNAICPGTVDTPSLAERIAREPDPQVARRRFIARQPMGRLGLPTEIAALALYLASDESAFTTGGIHVIDGGWTA